MHPISTGEARYDATGRLIFPANYREWVFLSAGLDMNYDSRIAALKRHVFGNVFASPLAYRQFVRKVHGLKEPS